MDAIFDRVVREFFQIQPYLLEKWLFRTAFGNKVFSRLIYNERLVNKNGVEWVNAVVELLELKCESEHHQFNNIPEHGATVVISNHPTVIDGLSLIHTVSRVRSDIKIIANHVLPIIFPGYRNLPLELRIWPVR